MRAVLLILLTLAACAPRPPATAYVSSPGTYTPPYPDLLRPAPPQETARTPDPWNNELEKNYMVDVFGVAEALGCKLIGRDPAVTLIVDITMSPAYYRGIAEARRRDLQRRAIEIGLASAPASCNAATVRFLGVLRARYGTTTPARAAPRPNVDLPPPPPRPTPPAGRGLPALKPGEIDI